VLKSATGVAINAALAEQDVKAIAEQLLKAFDDYLSQNDAEIIDTSALVVGPVMTRYFAQSPPFGAGEKKKEFVSAKHPRPHCGRVLTPTGGHVIIRVVGGGDPTSSALCEGEIV